MWSPLHFTTCTGLTILIALLNPSSASPTSSNPWKCSQSMCRYSPPNLGNPSWDKWGSVQNLVVFGASYAAAGSQADIIDPHSPWQTSCNGPNFISRLTNGLNKSVIDTKSYAIPGSPVSWYVLNGDKAPDPKTQGNSFLLQVGTYMSDMEKGDVLPAGMTGANTLYHMEFGINDINTAGSKYPSYEGEIFEKYSEAIDTLYQSGARNFLILSVPPVDRSPAAPAAGPTTKALWHNSVISFNAKTQDMIASLAQKYSSATFFKLGMDSLFDAILDNPSSFAQTKGLKDVNNLCQAYASAQKTDGGSKLAMDEKSSECEWRLNEYFWLSGYHPTWPVHEVMAQEIAEGLDML